MDNTSDNVAFLQTMGIIWYVIWVTGVVSIVPLYYVTLHNV